MKRNKITSLQLAIKLVELCKFYYHTTNASEAIYMALADFLLLLANEQVLDSFAMHQLLPNIDDRNEMGKYSIRIPACLFSIIYSLSEKDTISETVTKMLSRVLYLKGKNAPNIQCKPVLYVLGNKSNEKMQDAIRRIKVAASIFKFETCVETCAGALGIYSSFQFASKTILNDLDWDKVNLYKAIKENPRELVIRARAYTIGKATFDAQRLLYKERKESVEIDYEAAARYLFLNATQHHKYEGSFDTNMTEERYIKKLQNILPLHERLFQNNGQTTTITKGDAVDVVKKYRHLDNVLFIVDPPYHDTDYYNSAKEKFNDEKHENLAKELKLAKHNNNNNFLYFCRITAPCRYKGEERLEYNRHIKGLIDDLFYGKGFYFIDVPLDDGDGAIERIITSFDFEGATPYGMGVM